MPKLLVLPGTERRAQKPDGLKNLIPHFIQDRFLAEGEHGFLDAYTMFIDLSGFTAMTESMMARGTEGAERLSHVLNDIFAPMVQTVYRRGGIIPYFAGDAFTAIFPEKGDHALSAVEFMATARDIRELFSSKDFQFDDFEIGVKIGLSFGAVEWGIVGDETLAFYFRGEAVDACAESQMRANQQEIVLDNVLRSRLPDHFPVTPTAHPNFYYLSEGFKYNVPPETNADERNLELQPEVVRRFMPDSVVDFNEQGEFRNVISVFVSFAGVETHAHLDRFIRVVLTEINNFSGYFKEIDFGDKGGVLVGFFGAPVSYENNLERSLEFVTAVREQLEELTRTTPLKFRVGITSGLAYTGNVGGEERSQYAAVGNRVNIAARLMSYADWGEILVDSTVAKSRFFRFTHKGDIRYKGVAGAVPTYVLEGRNVDTQLAYDGPIIGRDGELDDLQDIIEEAIRERQPGFSYVYGEAGIGKSRLTFELKQRLQKNAPVAWYICQADQILRKPFNPFVYFLKNYFRQSPNHSTDENAAVFEQRFGALMNAAYQLEDSGTTARELERVRSVFLALVGLTPPAGSLYTTLDARGRYENTFTAITTLLRAEASLHPVVLELEDAHWYDENSREFLRKFVGRVQGLPFYFLVTSRYTDNGRKSRLIADRLLRENGIDIHEIDLGILQPEGMRSFAENRLDGSISEDLFEALKRTTNGNPFYLEQIVEYFLESNLLERDEAGEWTIREGSVRLSGSINSILTARIDRLSNLVKETVKAAAVIGREFEVPVLQEVMNKQDSYTDANGDLPTLLQRQIKSAERGQIWQAMNELRYIFKHSLLRETVYDMQLRARLRDLHAEIGRAIEKLYGDRLDEHYLDLAFHFEQAEDLAKAEHYFQLAADYSRDKFQNVDAILYYSKLIELLKKKRPYGTKQVRTYLELGNVQQLIGKWDDAEESFQDALAQAHRTRDRTMIARANYFLGRLRLLKGDYDDAEIYLETSVSAFEHTDKREGFAEVYGELGTLYFRQGDYDKAKNFFQKAIQLGRKSERGRIAPQYVANLGLAYMNQGEYATGIRHIERELEVCEELNDRLGQASLLINMGIVYFESGNVEAAGTCYERGLEMSEQLGNKLLITIAKGSLGRVRQAMGDYQTAMKLFQEDLKLAEELGDKQGISIALGLIGELQTEQGNFTEALDHMQRTLTLSEELNYQKGIAKSVNALGDIYYYTQQYDQALENYERAIEGARRIDNKLVLASSLIEKAETLIEMERFDEAMEALREGHYLAGELGNESIVFEQKLLRAEIQRRTGQGETALGSISKINRSALDEEQRAALDFMQFQLTKDATAFERARSAYRQLYEQTPKYIYHQRLQSLRRPRHE